MQRKNKLFLILLLLKYYFLINFFSFNIFLSKIENNSNFLNRSSNKSIQSVVNYIERFSKRFPFFSCLVKAAAFKNYFADDRLVKINIGIKKVNNSVCLLYKSYSAD